MKSTTQFLVISGLVAGAFLAGYVLTNPANCVAFCSQIVQTIPVEEFKERIDSKSYKLVDVRTPQEFAGGHIANATNADFENSDKFNEYLNTLNKNEKYLIYCRSGNRSGQALES